uniref:PawS-like protein CC.a n=1 Tax=Artemisia absinthium TaxID=72332 RepID=A0A1V0JB92_ARTAB|nr:PawS-like protein CC.a [Artemisia absinthium]
MAKLALLALAFTAIVAFSEVSAYRTTITTTTVDENCWPFCPVPGASGGIWDPIESPKQCRRQIQSKQLALDHCEMHITQQSPFESKLRMQMANPSQQEPHLQLCCNQLKNVAQPCQCEAIQQVFEQAQQQQQQKQGGRQGRQQGGQQQMQQMLRKAEQLPNDCKLEVQQCPIQIPRV